jgi:RNA polymerase sigma-70 factor (ECF subfamily)
VNLPSATSPGGDEAQPVGVPPPALTPAEETRLAGLVHDHFDFIWRSVRRYGVPVGAADDAAQQVFIVAARRIRDIQPGAERSFLFQTALRVASDVRREQARSREQLGSEGTLVEARDPAPDPEEAAQRKRSLEMLDEILASLDEDLRIPFVLFEIEGLEAKEIAELLGIPVGTVASRLRAAREEFHALAKRMRARHAFQERSR